MQSTWPEVRLWSEIASALTDSWEIERLLFTLRFRRRLGIR